ncbi:type II and III secretion system protein family protein [Obesumbacterium proteus]|uniref:type II and III secretion system protein family protein n=1 Tax=Obesumbacterium proteus TaxID=82983 RepID=UPI00242E4B1A|nr:pilus assembly protein N-terminal domain-containing protein [Obesumbacterium proteus]
MSFCLVTQKNKYKKAGCVNSKVSWLLGMTGLFLSYGVHAQEVYMEAGESQVIQVDGSIDTIFISAPKVADYEIIGDRGVMVYAKSDGQTDLIAFDKNGDQLIKTTLVVDPILSAVQKKVGQLVPDSQISIQKVGKTYILNGTVPTEEDRDRVYQIVGEGVGAKRTANKKDVPSTSGGSGGGSEGSNAWLDEVVYQEVINKLKLPTTNQFNVKLSVVEVTKTFSDNVGIDWGTISGTSGNITPGTFRFVKFNADTLSSLVHAISNDSVARVLAEPNLSVLSGESAEFLVGGEVPVVTSSANGSNVQYKDFGIKLNVGAKVSSSQRIRVTLGEEVSNVDSTYSTNAGDSFPAFQTRRAKTTVELADGESFLLGGLISNNEREDLSRLPFIGDVPILGALFRNAKTERTRGELVVVATVNLVKPVTMRDIVLPDFQRTSTLARFMNFEGISNLRDRKLAEGFVEQGGFIK